MAEIVQQNDDEGQFEVYARERVGEGLFYEVHSGGEVIDSVPYVTDLFDVFKARGIDIDAIHLQNGGEIVDTKDGLLRTLVHNEIVALLERDPRALTTRVRVDPSGETFYEVVKAGRVVATARDIDGLISVLIATGISPSRIEVPNGSKVIQNVTESTKGGVTRTFNNQEIKAFRLASLS